MKITKNKVVSVSYTLTENNEEGKFIEQTQQDAPFVFLYGHGGIIEGFEKNLQDLGVGDFFSFSVPAAQAYGEFQAENIIDLPLDVFKRDGEVDKELLQEGNVIPLQDEKGNVYRGTVKSITDSVVTMDFNHPLAGTGLHFRGQVLEVRDATSEEISHGHVHGAHGHQH